MNVRVCVGTNAWDASGKKKKWRFESDVPTLFVRLQAMNRIVRIIQLISAKDQVETEIESHKLSNPIKSQKLNNYPQHEQQSSR